MDKTKNQQLSTNNQQQLTINNVCNEQLARPTTINNQPTTNNHQPTTINQQPTTNNQQQLNNLAT